MANREILGISSKRPELRCPSSAVLQEYEDRAWKKNLETHLHQCSVLIVAEERCSIALTESGFSSPETPFLLQIEKSLLDLSSPYLTDGEFYCSLFKIDQLFYCRYFESGVLTGYFLSEGIKLLKCHIAEMANELSVSKLIWCQVSTIEDIRLYHERYTKHLERKRSHRSMTKPGTDIGRRFDSLMRKNKSSVLNSHRNLMAKVQGNTSSDPCQLLGTVINVIKHNYHKDKDPLHARFFETSGSLHPHLHTWENSIEKYRTDGILSEPLEFSTLFNSPSTSKFTWHEQCSILSAIPNNHYWNEGSQAHVGYGRMLSLRDSSGKYKPASIRNAILLNYREGNFHAIFQLIKKYYSPEVCDASKESTSSGVQDSNISSLDGDVETQPHTGIRRRALTEQDILRNIRQINPNFSTENRASESSAYHLFKTALIESGSIFWRIHQSDSDVVAMNDVNMKSGLFTPYSYVHMSRTTNGGELQYSCTCSLFTTLLQLATFNEPDTDIGNVNVRCCHIRFFQDVIAPDLPVYFSNEPFDFPTKSQKVVIQSLESLGKSICHLPSNSTSKKFSVISDDNTNCRFVHYSKNRLACQSGECQTIYGYSQRKVIYLDSTSNLCPHLDIMKKHQEIWVEDSLEVDDDVDEDEAPVEFVETEDTVEEDSNPQLSIGHFNPISGLWNFPSLSEHQPKEENDPALQLSIQRRLSIFDGAEGVSRDCEGYLVSEGQFLLCPPLDQANCNCGAGYFNNNHPDGILTDVRFRPLVYLSNGPARYVVRNRECINRSPGCTLEYCGAVDSIHLLSKETAVGDEIGWDFIDHALESRITFSAFCKLMTKKYKRNCVSSASFMAPQTFISWWFSWSSKFNIDFRQTCHICKHNPKMLACDGTKIGINFRHANVTAVEAPTSVDLIDPCHRRNDRAFLHFEQNRVCDNPGLSKTIQDCRDHLLYLSKKTLGLINEKDLLPFQTEVAKNTLLIETADQQCSDVFHRFMYNEYPHPLRMKLAVIFKMLSSSHSLSSFIPFRYVDLFQTVLMNLTTGTPESGNNSQISLIGEFSPEIREVLFSSLERRNVLRDIIHFFEYLISRVKHIKSLNKEPAPANPQRGSYNPEKNGVAYYFTETGEKLRNIPLYTMNNEAYSKNYDDLPARSDQQCNKIYPEVSRKGTTYLFLWFDPKHYGHCYGFHMIPGSEGRKDPFSSAYCYLEKAPDEVFYDFACQLEEYSLNREPGFWENTRFWHDLFHGYSHKCPGIYKSQRLVPLQNLNTEICEQFNSFIQRIKYSARSMTLSKFCYYLQFMIFHWCERKRSAFQKRCDIAVAYLA